MTAQKSNRQRAEQKGRTGEWLAALALQVKGYVIIERRVRSHRGEVDLIARRKNVLAFIEVKTREKQTDPAQILTPKQMARIVNGATGWAASKPWTVQCQWRYDLIVVHPWQWPKHLRDAWRPTGDPTLERSTKGGNVRASNMRPR
jgi:putative endonuclease